MSDFTSSKISPSGQQDEVKLNNIQFIHSLLRVICFTMVKVVKESLLYKVWWNHLIPVGQLEYWVNVAKLLGKLG